MKWEVKTVVNMRDREGQIQQTAGITASQEQLIPQFEGECLRLRGKHRVQQSTPERIWSRESPTTEGRYLGAIELQGEMELAVVTSQWNVMYEKTTAVRKMRSDSGAAFQGTKKTWEETWRRSTGLKKETRYTVRRRWQRRFRCPHWRWKGTITQCKLSALV